MNTPTTATEYVVWGIAPNDPTGERPLFTRSPRTPSAPITDLPTADCLANIAISRGATGVRIQTVRMDDPTAGW